jgi:RNA polymerase sigma-70 factor, ECF subfamily
VTAPQDVPTSPALVQVDRADAPRSNLDWVAALTLPGPAHEEALRDLHGLMVRAARHQVWRMRSLVPGVGAGALDELANGAADDALVALLAKVGTFEGRSRFTTWAYKFVVLEVSNKIGRHFWQRRTWPMEQEEWDRLPDRFGVRPAEQAEGRDLVSAVRRAVDEELTEHQRTIFAALVLGGVPVDALAIELGTTRNALYKTLFDARRKLRVNLVANGYLARDEVRRS